MKHLLLLLVAPLSLVVACSDDHYFEPEELGHHVLEGNVEEIYEQTSDEIKALNTLGNFVEVLEYYDEMLDNLEIVTDLEINGERLIQWMNEEETVGLEASFSNDRVIEYFDMKSLSPPIPQDNLFSRNKFTLPIYGEWYVTAGGTNQLFNHHYVVDENFHEDRYAVDLVIIDENNFTYEGDGEHLEDHYAYGQEVLAPADGVVVHVQDGIPDNPAFGERNMDEAPGNNVIIEHRFGEVSTILHLKEGSIVVEEGQSVEAGELIGLVGNSGNSSEPHLHFDVVRIFDEYADPRRINLINGQDPVLGDIVTGY